MIDWTAHRKHREQAIADTGQWVGLLDADGSPLMDLPPVASMVAPETRNDPGSLELTVLCRSSRGIIHPAVTELVAKQLGVLSPEGKLVPVADQTRFVAIERAGVPRRVYWVTHTVARGDADAPATLTIHGVGLTKLLSRFPAMSAPTTWQQSFKRFERDWVGPENTKFTFSQPRELAGMKLVTVADGATLDGPAEATIRRLITESLAAAFRVAGIIKNLPIQVAATPTGRPSPRILLRPTDGPLLEEIAQPAAAAGVIITARMWWPGDPPVTGLALSLPTVVVAVEQAKETP